MGKRELIDIAGELRGETEKAFRKQAEKLIAEIGESKPAMANLTKKALQALYKYAVKNNWVEANPIIGIDWFKVGTHHTWTEGELQTFEKRWPVGTRQSPKCTAAILWPVSCTLSSKRPARNYTCRSLMKSSGRLRHSLRGA
jgi:hypothetical protein